MRHLGLIAITSLVLLGTWATHATAVPTQVTFTGRVTDANGAINGSVNLTFEIFDAATAGTLMWDEVHTALTATNGLVYVNLGSQDPLNATVFTGAAMYLQLTVNGTPQTPRIPINSAPYATHAGTSALLGTLAPSDVALATHNHDTAYAALAHNHNTTYAALVHNHDTAYAALAHNHDAAYAALAHNHDAAYAAIAHNHDTSYYTKAQTDAAYAPMTHAHAATQITSGTLDNARFSAYSDLTAEGYLDDNASTDILRQSDGDARFATLAHTHPGRAGNAGVSFGNVGQLLFRVTATGGTGTTDCLVETNGTAGNLVVRNVLTTGSAIFCDWAVVQNGVLLGSGQLSGGTSATVTGILATSYTQVDIMIGKIWTDSSYPNQRGGGTFYVRVGTLSGTFVTP